MISLSNQILIFSLYTFPKLVGVIIQTNRQIRVKRAAFKHTQHRFKTMFTKYNLVNSSSSCPQNSLFLEHQYHKNFPKFSEELIFLYVGVESNFFIVYLNLILYHSLLNFCKITFTKNKIWLKVFHCKLENFHKELLLVFVVFQL